ncbi:hypothetical protein FHG87_001423 [Trinorchestia longiramus]|nr:hypothetical protein FHG87_001423 [Trinorchestia longiramus]
MAWRIIVTGVGAESLIMVVSASVLSAELVAAVRSFFRKILELRALCLDLESCMTGMDDDDDWLAVCLHNGVLLVGLRLRLEQTLASL